MAKVYSINSVDTKDAKQLIPSKEYVDNIAKQLEDKLISHINNSTNPHDTLSKIVSSGLDTSYTAEKMPVEEKRSKITLEDIPTNSENGFVSQATLMSLKERPTLLEVRKLIDDARESISVSIQNRFDEMLNMEDCMDKIKTLISIIREDDTLGNIMKVLTEKTDRDKFVEHVASELHLTNPDRKALNVLVQMCTLGFADWNAKPTDPNYIKNKPESLPANGGNADTVKNYPVEKLINKSPVDLIIGDENGSYDKDKVDHYIKIDYSNIEDIINLIQNNHGGKIVLRKAIYMFKELRICDGRKENDYDIILIGEGNNTIISHTDITVNNNVKIRDVSFEDSNLHIGSNCEFDNCKFNSCTIYLEGSVCSSIRNCNFKNCTMIYNGCCTGNIIVYNRFINHNGVQLLGKDNIVHNNLFIK